jgi:SAM-dependent methyltransferase
VAQNIYDDEQFFTGYSTLDRSRRGLAGAPEWPTMEAMLPDLAGKRVVDLGCGFGWFCRWAAGRGATAVLGVDISARMLARARSGTTSEPITYQQADLGRLELPPGSFDIAYSSLALHYLDDPGPLLATVWRALRPAGAFVLSVEHPIFSAPTVAELRTDEAGTTSWPLDRYLVEGPRVREWFAPGVIKHHRTIETWLRLLRAAGLLVDDLVGWGPSPAQLAAHPEWIEHTHRPMFLLISARAVS